METKVLKIDNSKIFPTMDLYNDVSDVLEKILHSKFASSRLKDYMIFNIEDVKDINETATEKNDLLWVVLNFILNSRDVENDNKGTLLLALVKETQLMEKAKANTLLKIFDSLKSLSFDNNVDKANLFFDIISNTQLCSETIVDHEELFLTMIDSIDKNLTKQEYQYDLYLKIVKSKIFSKKMNPKILENIINNILNFTVDNYVRDIFLYILNSDSLKSKMANQKLVENMKQKVNAFTKKSDKTLILQKLDILYSQVLSNNLKQMETELGFDKKATNEINKQ